MKTETTADRIPSIETFGYKIYYPPTATSRSGKLLDALIRNTVEGCRNLTEVFKRICGLGCLLIYKPRYRCFVMYPNRDSLIDVKIREFESL